VFRNRNDDRMHRTVGLGARHGSLVTERHISGIMHVILVEVFWVFAVPAIARVRRSSPGSRPSPAGDLWSALTPAAVRRVDEAAGAGKMDGLVGCMVQTSLRVVVAGR
jgi:hypothetical protein